MDSYTSDTRRWLDKRFCTVDADGVYLAHQPIYGFRGGHCEPDLIDRYTRTYAILVELAGGPFQSLLDVGAAEGYKAELARRLVGLRVAACDLSREACRRGREIYGLDAVAADVHHLPFTDESFDVVLCSETLEHVTDVQAAVSELLRVARMAVLITVPHDSEEHVESVRRVKVPHGHIHRFDVSSFEYLKVRGFTVVTRPTITDRARLFRALVEGAPRTWDRSSRFPRFAFSAYRLVSPVLRRVLGSRAAAAVIWLDWRLSKASTGYGAVVCTIWKRRVGGPSRRLRALDITQASVPLHRLPATAKATRR